MKPNILVLLAEDMCANLGCYGDPDAISPNLDKLAQDGIRYTHASSVAPVCSAARTTLALGVYPFTAGVGNHRSCVKLPDHIKVIGKYMHDNGYFTAINKTDYNFSHDSGKGFVEGWDTVIAGGYFEDTPYVAQRIADTWRKKGDKPFYFMATMGITHQSQYGFPNTPEEHRKAIAKRSKPEEYIDRAKLHIPPYHPDNADTREIWGQYREVITAMDRTVGETIEYLKQDGLYEDTIIIFAGDNGMGIPAGKANMWDEGCNVPMIVHIPEKWKCMAKDYKAGTVSDSAVEFVDLAPTVIRIAGGEVPSYMQGKDFLMNTDFQEFSYNYRNRIDAVDEFVRSVRSNKFIYIRNFYPQRGWRFSSYMARMAPNFVVSWERDVKADKDTVNYTRKNAFFMDEKPIEELYDLQKDPYQMHNVASDPAYADTLVNLRGKLVEFMLKVNDLGFIPEYEADKMAKDDNSTVHTVGQKKELYPLETIMEVCNKMITDKVADKNIVKYLDNSNPIVRYWAIEYANYFDMQDMIDKIKTMLDDQSEAVRLASAEAIMNMTDAQETFLKAQNTIGDLLSKKDPIVVLKAANSLNRLGKKAIDLIPNTQDVVKKVDISDLKEGNRYTQAIGDITNYYAACMDKPLAYDVYDEHMQGRLAMLKKLKEEADL